MLFLLGVLVLFVGILLSIALHEVGHLVPAKRSGVKVTQYMVGFGPTLWSRRRGETEYGIKAVPLGGYIRMIGMFPPRRDRGEDETHLRQASTGWMRAVVEDARNAEIERIGPEDADRVFYKQPVRNKLLIMLGGPTMNLVIGLVLLTILLLSYGLPKLTNLVGAVPDCVLPASAADDRRCEAGDPVAPAKAAGLQTGDRIVAFNGAPVEEWESLQSSIRGNPDREVRLTVERGGERLDLPVTLIRTERPKDPEDPKAGETVEVGYLGVAPRGEIVRLAPAEVPAQLWEFIERTATAVVRVPERMVGVWQAAFGGEERDPNGPIGVVGVTRLGGEVVQTTGVSIEGGAQLLYLLAGLNLALWVFNLIPLLPLDGGHVAGALYEGARRQVARVRKRPDPGPADVARMLPVAYAMATVLITMSALLLYADIVNPIRLQ